MFCRGVDNYQQSSTSSSSTTSAIGGGSVGQNSTTYFDQTPSATSSASATPEATFNSFGILPHESLVPSSLNGSSPAAATTSLSSKPSTNYGNFNSQFSNVIVGAAAATATTAAQQLLHQQQQQSARSR